MNKTNKFTYEFKLQCVEAVIKGKRSAFDVAKENVIVRGNLRLWIKRYELYGKAGLRKKVYQPYDITFKLKVLQSIERENLSLRTACARFKIPSMSTIIKWQRAYESEGVQGLTNKPKVPPSKMKPPIKRKARKSSKPLTREQELLEELEYLRAENALLKKLQALVQADKKQKP
jgi:transposase